MNRIHLLIVVFTKNILENLKAPIHLSAQQISSKAYLWCQACNRVTALYTWIVQSWNPLKSMVAYCNSICLCINPTEKKSWHALLVSILQRYLHNIAPYRGITQWLRSTDQQGLFVHHNRLSTHRSDVCMRSRSKPKGSGITAVNLNISSP